MYPWFLSLLLAVLAACTGAIGSAPRCKCIPGQCCWPSAAEWKAFDIKICGSLIKAEPIAQSCYPGPEKDLKQCAYVNKMWSDQDFQSSNPIGRPYPYNITCAPVDYAAGQKPKTCSLGSLPVYAVNATTLAQIRSTVAFARERNIRLVVTGTGHDLLGRSDGFGGLELWLHQFKNGINFQKTYKSKNRCKKSNWRGSAIKIDGNYQWRDVYKVAEANNVIAVGGGSITPGAIGGWASGGGHGPATRNYGLGADQILEAEVMLADGRVVIANHCENTDLFRSMRGGGPGYGITLSSTIKAHPNVKTVTAHHLQIAPLEKTEKNADLLDAVTVLLQSLPGLNDAGFAGYGYWVRNSHTVFVGNATSGYSHGVWTIGKDREEAEAAWAPVRKALSKFEDKLFSNESWATYNDYWSFYHAESGLYDPTGDTSVLTSRLIDRQSVKSFDKVRDAVEVMSGKPDEFGTSVILLTSGGQVFKDASDKTSGLHPAWRQSHYVLISSTGISRTGNAAERKAANDDVTFVKGAAAKKLAPNTGGYMNEGDRNDPDWKETFYGSLYGEHLKTKSKYDPSHVFYCPTCVGSEEWVERPDGPLCRVA
ncbi:6-hydroxy-D-nicotine oxidase [Fusarium pseudocircinatum]|uniref:6-hydroxy-D-nicotine oxidase n=1 Tax=Fusarium pseudocircinatum TaxID=56676 RepID=A0A8H5PW23_9HYPO|nr:6-hydroxy-D-nicotine oxidase [Fusarium pseudocircinatum]